MRILILARHNISLRLCKHYQRLISNINLPSGRKEISTITYLIQAPSAEKRGTSNMPKKVEKIFPGNAILQSENRSKRGDKNEKSERSHQSKRPYKNL